MYFFFSSYFFLGASRVGPLLLALLASAAEEEGSAAVPPDASLEMAAVKRSATATVRALRSRLGAGVHFLFQRIFLF